MIELGLKHGDRGLNFIGDRLHIKGGGSVHSLGLGVCWCGLGSHSIVFGLYSFVLGSGLHSSVLRSGLHLGVLGSGLHSGVLVRVGGIRVESGGEVVVVASLSLLLLSR